jgi:hypothetical protein
MPRQKVTLTLSTEALEELRELVGARSLSAAVDRAIAAELNRLRHLAALDEWLLELDRAHGPVPAGTLDWAARIVGEWEAGRRKRVRRAG